MEYYGVTLRFASEEASQQNSNVENVIKDMNIKVTAMYAQFPEA
jgi:hypothetical protein